MYADKLEVARALAPPLPTDSGQGKGSSPKNQGPVVRKNRFTKVVQKAPIETTPNLRQLRKNCWKWDTLDVVRKAEQRVAAANRVCSARHYGQPHIPRLTVENVRDTMRVLDLLTVFGPSRNIDHVQYKIPDVIASAMGVPYITQAWWAAVAPE